MGRGHLATGTAAVSGGGVPLPAGCAAAGHLRLQTCHDPGGGVSVVAQEHPPAIPSAHRTGDGGALSRVLRDPTRAAGPSLYRVQFNSTGHRLLAAGGQRAIERSAYVEAVAHLTKGLELLMLLPDTSERAQQELSLQTALGLSWMTTKGMAASGGGSLYAGTRALPTCWGYQAALRGIHGTVSTFAVSGESFRRRVNWVSSVSSSPGARESRCAYWKPTALGGPFILSRRDSPGPSTPRTGDGPLRSSTAAVACLSLWGRPQNKLPIHCQLGLVVAWLSRSGFGAGP